MLDLNIGVMVIIMIVLVLETVLKRILDNGTNNLLTLASHFLWELQEMLEVHHFIFSPNMSVRDDSNISHFLQHSKNRVSTKVL